MLLISAQVMGQHLNFMGIPIDGTLEEFAEKMEAKGFKKATRNSMKGTFGGYYCNLIFTSSDGMLNKKDDNINAVKVSFKEYQKSSQDIFHNLSKWLTVKYGQYEQYPEYYIKEDNGYRVCMSRVWTTSEGTISLLYGQEVELRYIDRVRSKMSNDNDILNDL